MAPLTRQMTLGAALELALWADTQFDARRCYEIGWAQRVVPAEQLMPTALDYAKRMLTMAPRAVRNMKQMLYRGAYVEPLEAYRMGTWLEQNLVGMSDSVEGPRAFAEKRDPNFTDS
jgi:enoyl-CoA hydratase/carnithine racemase